MKKTNPHIEDNWKKVYIYTGDEYISRIFNFSETIVERLDTNTSVSKIINSLQSVNIFDSKRCIKIYNPNAAQLKAIYESIINSKINVDYVQIYCCNDSLDGRSAIASKAKSSGRIFHYGAIEYSNTSPFNRFLNDWLSSNNIKISGEAMNYLEHNSPSSIVKIKSGATKKEVIVYDLPLLINELTKLACLDLEEITLNHVHQFDFENHNKNIFDFFNLCMSGEANEILSGLNGLNESHGHQMILMIYLSQLFFYLKIAEFKELKTKNENMLKDLSLEPYLKKFLDIDFKEIEQEIPLKQVNPIRLQIAYNQTRMSSKDVSNQIQSTLNAVIDLRNNLSTDIVFPYYSLCLSHKRLYKVMTYNYNDD
jgi:DNA polymerase III delta subunit